jgi:hypothetical protein
MPEDPPLGMVLDGGGLRPATGDLRVDFGREQTGAVEAATKLIGEYPSRQTRLLLCGVAVDWALGFRMIFKNGDFVGWTAVPGRFGTGGGTYETQPDGRIGAGETCQTA